MFEEADKEVHDEAQLNHAEARKENFSTKPKKFQGSFRVTNFAMNHQKELKLVALQ